MGRRRPVEKKMFGGLAFLLGGHMAIAVSGQDGILVRVPPEQTNALRAEPGVHPFVMRDKPMTGWLRVGPDVLEDDEVLRSGSSGAARRGEPVTEGLSRGEAPPAAGSWRARAPDATKR